LTSTVEKLFINANKDMRTNVLRKFPRSGQLASITTLAILVILGLAPRANAFSLLGPYADWMTQSHGYRQAVDIGGPMNLNEEYRWNVPTVTYAFDKSFLDYFGSNGVAAVESAIQILNDLPSASDVALSNFPNDTRRANFVAQAQNVYDLKSVTLALLVEQLGLGQPTRNVLDVPASFTAQFPVCTNQVCPGLVGFQELLIVRNFDPATLVPSYTVNGTAYNGFYNTNNDGTIDIIEFPINPLDPEYSAVADAFSFWYSGLQPGTFYTGLTRDDVGGLAYLLNATNVNWESLPKDVLFIGKQRGRNKKLRGSWRPGVEKINFVPQPENKRGKFKTAIFKYTAGYLTNGVVTEQTVKRVVTRPDILFTAQETFKTDPVSPMFLRTGTQSWTNNAAQNSDATNAGPGVITGPIKITFDELGPEVLSGDHYTPAVVMNRGWASFDQSTNPPITYPPNSGQSSLTVRLNYYVGSGNTYTNFYNSMLNTPAAFGAPATLQITTNNTDWISLTTVTNSGSIIRWDYYGKPVQISFRVLPGAQ
jgi:hypothetical protein